MQAKKQSGKKFIIHEIPYVWPKNILKKKNKKLNIGFNPNLFTNTTLIKYFDDSCNLTPINKNLFNFKRYNLKKENLIYKIDNKVIGESAESKIKRVVKFLRKEKIDNLFISSGENVCWLLNIRGKDLPNSPVINCQAFLSNKGKIYLFVDIRKLKIVNNYLRNKKINFFEPKRFFSVISSIKTNTCVVDSQTCSMFNESLIKSCAN